MSFFSGIKAKFQAKAFKIGGYSIIVTAAVIVLAIIANVIIGALPTSVTAIDTTSTALYSISGQTKSIVGSVDPELEINIYWISQKEEQDETLGLLLDKYDGLSSRINVYERDPDVYPTFLEQYDVSTAENNSVIVECGDNFRYIPYDDIFTQEVQANYSTYSYDTYEYFAGESCITSAISYVTSDDLPVVYTLTGDGESTLSDEILNEIAYDNIEIEELSLLTVDAVPEDAAAVIIYAPTSDISDDAKSMLIDYVDGGGNIIVVSSLVTDDDGNTVEFDNLDTFIETYGVSRVEGLVIDNDSNHYVYSRPYYLLPDLNSHTVTDPLIDESYYVLMPLSQGLTVEDYDEDSVSYSVTQLLTTSDSSISKASGYNMTTAEEEEGDTEGPFALAVDIETETGGDIFWITSEYLLEESVNESVSGGNLNFFLNILNYSAGKDDSISIRAKSMNAEYLTIDSTVGTILDIVFIGVVPLIFVAAGVYVWLRRRAR